MRPSGGVRELEEVLASYLNEPEEARRGKRPRYLRENPTLARDLEAYFANEDRIQELVAPGESPAPERQAPPKALPTGSLLGPYRLDEVIGVGGMGTIYRATHLTLERTVAIKVLPKELAEDFQLVHRFKREARALAKLEHPNIVRIHDMGTQGELYFFVMEHVDGTNLRQIMETGELSPAVALSLVPKICQALEYAHEQGIVHRDIKPENILVDRSGEPKIADFGLARVLQAETALGRLTRTDVVMGTFNYMAPEQRRSAEVDHRADIYALGVVLYEMLTGELPDGELVAPSSRLAVDDRVDRVVRRALEREPAARYQRASHMGRDVSDVIDAPLDGRGPAPPPPRSAEARELRVVDAEKGTELGRFRAASVRVRLAGDEELQVRGWTREEVGVEHDGGLKRVKVRETIAPGESEPTLEIALPEGEVTVHVPHGLALEVDAPEAPIEVSGRTDATRVRAGKGEVTVRYHRGPLDVERVGKGRISVYGLASEDVRLRSQEGRVTVSGLRLAGGRGEIRSGGGSVRVGVLAEECSFAYEARSAFGDVHVDLDARRAACSDAQLYYYGFAACVGLERRKGPREPVARGELGSGRGRLVLETNTGKVRLVRRCDLVAVLAGEIVLGAAAKMVIPALVLTWLGLWWAAILMFGCWGGTEFARARRKLAAL